MTQPIGIALPMALLREEAPDLVLRPGMNLVARVLERHESRGLISLAGAVLVAELPEHVREGDKLRLQVQDTSAERVVLRLQEQPQAQPAAVPLPLPGEPRLRVADGEAKEERKGEGGGESIALVYESPKLGPLELRLELSGGAVRAVVGARAGEPHQRASEAANELRDALATALDRPADVKVEERRDPLDVYA